MAANSNNYKNVNMSVFNSNMYNANANNSNIQPYAYEVLGAMKSNYGIAMLDHEEKAMLYLLSSFLIETPPGQGAMKYYYAEKHKLLSKAIAEIEKSMSNNNSPNVGGRRRTLRKRTHRLKTRRNRK